MFEKRSISQPMNRVNRWQKGFTLIELMIVLTIVAVLLLIASPNYDSVMIGSRLDKERLGLATSLALARSEAVKRGVPIRLCKGTSNLACTGSSTGATTWVGWSVVQQDTETLQVNQGDATTQLEYSCGDYLEYSPTGTRTSSPAGECFFYLDDLSGDVAYRRTIWISSAGRVRLSGGS